MKHKPLTRAELERIKELFPYGGKRPTTEAERIEQARQFIKHAKRRKAARSLRRKAEAEK